MNPVVYDWFRARVEGGFEDAPFYATQGEMLEQKGLPNLWLTMETSNPSLDRLTVGNPALYRESGNVVFMFMIKSGLGPREALVAAQHFSDYMRNTFSPQAIELTEDNGIVGNLQIPIVGAPDPDPFENGNWLLSSVSCTYTYDSVRGAA